MSDRWMLDRAGIVNVYQYDDETIEFGGGRLLLRGVNGSGKSTAMNMLLPFLLDADTRRIDAAGEQSGVLRSWMLSGRDEAQPQGYLWIGFRRGDDHLTCGCGIRANRSTDRVTTWWFITDRRPGIDLALVEKRTPLSADALRVELGPNAVYAQDQKGAYRAEVRRRLYGGADLDQHVRLLHVVRNPRVGDRIDVDLPGYLEDALPQLSDAALDDAAQPLEDLEEHRRNVEELTRTAGALAALEAVYQTYARAELHRRADDALELVEVARRLGRDEAAAERRVRDAREAAAAVAATIEQAERDERRLRTEIDTLKRSDAYEAGGELTDLRTHVRSLAELITTATTEVARRVDRRAQAVTAVGAAGREAQDQQRQLRDGLTDLVVLTLAAGVAARPPDVPALETQPQTPPGTPPGIEVPAPVDLTARRTLMAELRAAAASRRGDVREVQGAIDLVDEADAALRHATAREDDAADAAARADEALADARAAHRHEIEKWRGAIEGWIDELHQHRRRDGLPALPGAVLDPVRLAEDHAAVIAALEQDVQGTFDHHRQLEATLLARLTTETERQSDARARVAELAVRSFPEPPALAWQRSDRSVCLADLIDFADHVTAHDRAGLEAAMEAAGLLAAEPTADGRFVVGAALEEGQLLAVGGPAATRPLSADLVVTIPPDLAGSIPVDAVQRVLDAISTDADDLGADTAGDLTVVTPDGHFRTGLLRGHHTKPEAEHIGVTARRALLERQRDEAAAALDRARADVERTEADLRARRELIAEAGAIRSRVPPAHEIVAAQARAELTETALQRAIEHHLACQGDRQEREVAHASALDGATRTAATLGLPADRDGLALVGSALADVGATCDRVDRDLTALHHAVERWRARVDDWRAADGDVARSEDHLRAREREHEPLAMRLATLEDSVGLEYEAVVASLGLSERELDAVVASLGRAHAAQLEAHGEVERRTLHHAAAAEERARAEHRSVAELAVLHRTLAVPGLVASARPTSPPPASPAAPGASGAAGASGASDAAGASGAADASDAAGAPPDAEVSFPPVAESPDGVRELARSIKAQIPAPERPASTEGVRQSLRQRRDSLGAGWDAEDRQPDETLPLHIEVNGPIGRLPLADAGTQVRRQLAQLSSLLTAKQDQALRNLLQGLIAREVAEKLHTAKELVGRMNRRLDTISTSHGIGVSLRWRRRDDLETMLAGTVDLLAKPPDLRTADEDQQLTRALSERIADARRQDPDAPYRDLISNVLDYRAWHRMTLMLHRPGEADAVLGRRTALSEGEKKMVSYLPLFAAVAASCDALAELAPDAPRFVLLDDAFAKVSEDNHAKLFGLLVELDLDFIATSERLWGTHATVPELAITEVLRDADNGVIVLEHSRWDGAVRRVER